MLLNGVCSFLITTIYLFFPVSPSFIYCGNKVEILELNHYNFDSFILNQSYATIVYFHKPNCDYCKHFLRPFNVFANEIVNWVSTGLVRLAKLNCENSENDRICRSYKISDYPFFVYFKPYLGPKSSGYTLNVTDSHHLSNYLSNLLVKKAEEYNLTNNTIWPDLQPLKPTSKRELFSFLPCNSHSKIVLFTLEHTDKAFGRLSTKAILDSHQFKDSLVVVSVSDTNGLSAHADYNVLNGKQQLNAFRLYQLIDKNSEKAKLLIRLEMRGVEQEQQVRGCINRFIRHRFILQRPIERLNGSQVHHILEQMFSLLEPNNHSLRIFIKFQKVVTDYFPFVKGDIDKVRIISTSLRPGTKVRIHNTDNNISRNSSLTGIIWSLCSLWPLYYTLVIGEYKTQPTKRLTAYFAIQDIFSLLEIQCEECVTRFHQSMGQQIHENYQPDSSILWLWQVHNDMNHFIGCDGLIGEHKTVEPFPSKNQCPECFTEYGTWNEKKVKDFLISYFWPNDVSTTELDTADNIALSFTIASALVGVILILAFGYGFILFKTL